MLDETIKTGIVSGTGRSDDDGGADDGADVVYAGQIIIGEDTPLVLGAGLEGCWLHTGLTPDFFMNERLALSALKLES